METRDQALLNKILKENSDSIVRHKLIKKYNLYYSHWLDYSLLVAGLATIGLIIGLFEWEHLYKGIKKDQLEDSSLFTEWIIMIISILGMLAIILKYRMEATWRHYDNPVKFYRKILRAQVDIGLKNDEVMDEKVIAR